MEVAPVLKVSQAEERGSEPSVCEHPLCDGLSDGALPRSSQSIQPIDGGPLEVLRPVSNLIQNSSAGSLEATFTATMAILGCLCATEIVEDSCISYWRFASGVFCQRRRMF